MYFSLLFSPFLIHVLDFIFIFFSLHHVSLIPFLFFSLPLNFFSFIFYNTPDIKFFFLGCILPNILQILRSAPSPKPVCVSASLKSKCVVIIKNKDNHLINPTRLFFFYFYILLSRFYLLFSFQFIIFFP